MTSRAPALQPPCGETVPETHAAAQYHEDLLPFQPTVSRFAVHIGTRQGCHWRVYPLQTSDAVGAAGIRLGPYALALAIQLNGQFGVSFGTILILFRHRFRRQATPRAVVSALHREIVNGRLTYDALGGTIQTTAVVVPDEAG